MEQDDDVLIGFVARPHGVHGAVKVRPTGPTVGTLALGETVSVGGESRDVAQIGGTEDRPVLRFDGISDRDAALELKGAEIRVAGDRLPEPDLGEFYVRDLIGCRVREGDDEIGVIAEIQNGPANDALIVEKDGRRHLIAFVVGTVEGIDLDAREIRVAVNQSVELSPKGGS